MAFDVEQDTRRTFAHFVHALLSQEAAEMSEPGAGMLLVCSAVGPKFYNQIGKACDLAAATLIMPVLAHAQTVSTTAIRPRPPWASFGN
jgi:hypothetical protein